MPPATARERVKKPKAPKLASVRGTRARLEVDARRAQLVTLGIDLFAAHAYDEVSIDELARAAGISKGLLYHYFPTKRDFYIATVQEASRQLLELTETSTELDPVDRLRGGLDAYLDYVEAHAPAYAALMRGGVGSDPEVARVIDETRAKMCDRLLLELPEVAPTPLIRIAVRGWLGFCEATSLDWLERRTVKRVQIRDLMLKVLLATIPIAAGEGAVREPREEPLVGSPTPE
jgi:AcrR family transcriptional regulator